ncbi:hypothetical protein CC86DRAFT_447630 [Ophiobolus disseminans]|uniref:Aminoglycoside phosphotransferase domain-containing protein n=1 Tax=Ophiobolus disseminans TaxID=1469910 RepID=A0A6A6ZUE6_9PLEO|nr:hypothetical protein CC86DRAFT_447630 [Ophiobolus disseminans]
MVSGALFEYTSGRWVYNEDMRLVERYLAFNVDELKKVVANAVDRPASDIERVHKLAEGGFNWIFELTTKDGLGILARLPYPSTSPRCLAVAGEVATMDFVRTQGIPTPRILGYSFDENAVGSEYIILKKLPGRPLGDAWFELSEQERLQVLKPETHTVAIPGAHARFCVGPYAAHRWWFGEHGILSLIEGRELAWIHKFGRHRYPFHRQHREAFRYEKQDLKVHANSLESYLQVAPYLVPTDLELHSPVLRHPDVQLNNIFVSADYKVTSLIDWQHAIVLPKSLAAGIPNSFQNYNDPESSFFSPPHLRADIDSHNDHEHILRRRAFDYAGEPWEGLNTPLQYDLAQISQHWDEFSPTGADGTKAPCPVSFIKDEADQIDALDDSHRDADGDVEHINDLLGIGSDSWTPHERFDDAKRKAAEIREQALASADDDPWLREMSERHWPFDDFDKE